MKTAAMGILLLALLFLPALSGGETKASPAALAKEAKITMEQAQKTALAREAGKIKSKEMEKEKGRLIYSFDIKMADGIHEVNVDANTGEIVEDTVENAASEAKEKAEDAMARKKAKAAPPNN